MSFRIDKVSVTAQSRMLKGQYSDELTADLQAIHGLSARDEVAKMLSNELSAEMNRETVAILMNQAVLGCRNTITAATTGQHGFFDLDIDADGRWAKEKYLGLILRINREAHEIAYATGRGIGNVVITTSNVVSALEMTGQVDKTFNSGSLINVDGFGVTYAGILNGRFRVYIDPYATTDYVLVGYKGKLTYDAGVFWCPYVPFQMRMIETKDAHDLQNIIAFKTRHAHAVNPFVGDGQGGLNAGTFGKNEYYRKFVVKNLVQ